MIALVDCNNFYASCERVFRPDWEGRPIAVLSNNDGCVIARSEECKRLGVPMGIPMFKIPFEARQQMILVSSNYALYGDMSQRVTTTLRQFTSDVDIFSIDESFLGLDAIPKEEIEAQCRLMRDTVRRNTGIPVSIGVSTSCTLAKVANRLAKAEAAYAGVCRLDPDSALTRRVLEQLPVTALFGVSGRLGVRLQALDIHTAWQLREAEPKRIRQHFSVVQERIVLELRGISCIDTDDYGDPKKHIMTSRSFGRQTDQLFEVQAAVRAHAARGAEKLRQQGSLARAVQVHLKTNRHRMDAGQYHPAIIVQLPHPSDDARIIIKAAQAGLIAVWRKGYRFMKAGVMMLDLVQHDTLPVDMFNAPEREADQARATQLNAVMDQLNRKMGRGTLRLGDTRSAAAWKLKANLLTPRYTTRWDELPKANMS